MSNKFVSSHNYDQIDKACECPDRKITFSSKPMGITVYMEIFEIIRIQPVIKYNANKININYCVKLSCKILRF